MLAYINIFSADIDRLADFYAGLFGLQEIEASRSPLFRGFSAGGCSLGFSSLEAHAILGSTPSNDAGGSRFMLTFEADDRGMVDRMTTAAQSRGATLIREPFTTYYGWYQSVLSDPDGNVFRINFVG